MKRLFSPWEFIWPLLLFFILNLHLGFWGALKTAFIWEVVLVAGFYAILFGVIGLLKLFKFDIGHIELQILLALIGIGIAIFFANRDLGVWKALEKVLLWEGGAVMSVVVLFFAVLGIGKLFQRLKGGRTK